MILHWSRDNRKLQRRATLGFGIPAFRSAAGFVTCPQAGACAAVCYARQGNYTFPSVQRTREANLLFARQPDFARWAIADLASLAERQRRRVRIHDSGDFFSQAYLNAWIEIAQTFPRTTFYAYTKSLHLDWSTAPPNLRIIQSEGGRLPVNRRQPHARIFVSHAERKQAGYGDGSHTDKLAEQGAHKIGLVYHGARPMTEPQRKVFQLREVRA